MSSARCGGGRHGNCGGDRVAGQGAEGVDIETAARIAHPYTWLWIGKDNHENRTLPVLNLRESAQKAGLLRKYRGSSCSQLRAAPCAVTRR